MFGVDGKGKLKVSEEKRVIEIGEGEIIMKTKEVEAMKNCNNRIGKSAEENGRT